MIGQKDVFANGLDFKWDLYPEAWSFGKCCHCLFSICHLKSVIFSLALEWSSFHMIETFAIAIPKAWPFEVGPSKSPEFNWFWISNGRISDSPNVHDVSKYLFWFLFLIIVCCNIFKHLFPCSNHFKMCQYFPFRYLFYCTTFLN